MRMLSLEMHFLSQGEEILSNPLIRARAYQDRSQARYQVAFHGSKIMMMPGSYKEKEGNNHERRPMVGSKKGGKG